MARVMWFVAAAIAALVVLWFVFAALLHTLFFVFWIALVVVLGLVVFRVGRWSGRRSSQ
jgi:uncharacterized membrane protein